MSSQSQKEMEEKKQLLAFAARTFAAITVDPDYFSSVNGGSLKATLEIFKDLQRWADKDVAIKLLYEDLKTRFPPNLETVDRFHLLKIISRWLQDQVDEFHTKIVKDQRALLMIVRICIRWLKLGDELNGFIEILIEGECSSVVTIRALTLQCLTTYASLQHVSMNELFRYFAETIATRLAKSLIHKSRDAKVLIISNCRNVFQFISMDQFLLCLVPYIFQTLVLDGSPAAITALTFVASYCFKNTVIVMLSEFFHVLLPELIVRAPDEIILEQGLQVIERLTGKKRINLIKSDCNGIHNELLLHLNTNPAVVLKGLKFIARMQGIGDLRNDEDVANYLQPRFLCFAFFVDKRMQDNLPLKVKRNTLKSFSLVIQFMSSRHISSVRVKLMAILKYAIQTLPPELHSTCFEAWTAFIKTLDMPSLKSILSQVAVILLPFVKTHPDFVVPILAYLIVQNRQSLHDHFQELFFLPDVPALADVNAVLVRYTKTQQDVATNFPRYLMEQLQFVDVMDTNNKVTHNLSLATDDRRLRVPQMEVRQYALRKLKMLIRDNQIPLFNMVVAPDQKSRSGRGPISQLMATLMNCSKEAVIDSERHRFGEVLGSIGAIDPDWVEMENSGIIPARWLVFPGVRDKEFAVNFLKELVVGYMTTEKSKTQDTYGIVIQEALKFFELRDDKQTRYCLQNNEIWDALSKDYQELLTPFLTSKYIMIPPETPEIPENMPEYGSPSASTYAEWIKSWTVDLIRRINTKTTTTDFLRQFIHLFQNDSSRCVSLLPYVVLYLLVHCDVAQKKKLFLEMDCVLKSHDSTVDISADLRLPAIQTVLSLLDFLREWCQSDALLIDLKAEQLLIAPANADLPSLKQFIHNVAVFIGMFPDELIAQASFRCHACPKALRYYEHHLRSKDKTCAKWLSDKKAVNFMQQIYLELEEDDGISGLNNARIVEPSIEDKIVLHMSTGNIQEALLCYEQLAQMSQNSLLPNQHGNIIRGLMDLDEPSKAILYCNGILTDKPDWIDELNGYRIEAAWRLGHWDALETYLDLERDPLPNQWNVGIGRLLLDAKQGNSDSFQATMGTIQAHIMAPICAASMDKAAYHRSYDNVVQLHTLFELEGGATTWFNIQPDAEFPCVAKPAEQLLKEWSLRFSLAQPSYHNMQKILTVRRVILQATGDEKLRPEIGRCWLQSAKIARKANHLQTAYSFLLKGEAYGTLEVPREQAKYLWAKGDTDKAIAYLEKATQDQRWAIRAKKDPIFVKTKLLLARYLDESKSLATADMCAKFREIVQIAPALEKSHFYLGQYYDKMLEGTKKDLIHREQVPLIIEEFVESLKYGCHYIHQTLPRLLSLWLDFGAQLTVHYPLKQGKPSAPPDVLKNFQRIQELIKNSALSKIPKYIFLTAFPQLISRICIVNDDAFALLAEVIAALVQAFPQQTMWHLAPVCQSNKEARTKRYARIMDKVRYKQPEPMIMFLVGMEEFCKHCTVLCNIKPASNRIMTIDMEEIGELRGLRRLLRDTKWVHPVLPFRSYMTPALPAEQLTLEHKPFATNLPTIVEFVKDIALMSSLQRPKKVGVVDSIGNTHYILMKPSEDLRKDSRFMELVEMMNKFLREDSEARRRQLKIRTYSVVPLNEDCGIIEWVPNLITIRHLLINTYYQLKIEKSIMGQEDLANLKAAKHASIEEKMKFFMVLFRKHPNVMHVWQAGNFSDPAAWLAARVAFSRTTGVMCMVGYIMGLGDRHLENILIDTANGEVLHVDFSCLFNKGKTLDWPEKVPFRLTHNIIDGMGPLGVEGFCRTASELTLGVVRHHKNALISVLKTFINDPLVEWQQKKKENNLPSMTISTDTGESQNREAIMCVLLIERRISGQISEDFTSLPLSVQGQFNYLIREATSLQNLCQMYHGWAPFM